MRHQRRGDSAGSRESGQVLVLFTLGLLAMIAAVGLVLDGGSAFASRRDQQRAVDLAAMAGANAYLVNADQSAGTAQAAASAAAQVTAAANGFTHGSGSVTVGVTYDLTNGAAVTVDISAPHQNFFSGIVGMPTWTISTTATAQTGFPDTAVGAAPFIFNIGVFQSNGRALGAYSNPSSPYSFGDGNGDVPNDPGDIAWTCYGTCGNVDTNTVRDMIDGSAPMEVNLDATVDFNTYIGQQNNGNHTALYPVVNTYLAGEDVSVPIVDDNGLFQGWATFHVTSAEGGSSKTITGYFKSGFQASKLSINCPMGGCPRYLGSYVLKLTN